MIAADTTTANGAHIFLHKHRQSHEGREGREKEECYTYIHTTLYSRILDAGPALSQEVTSIRLSQCAEIRRKEAQLTHMSCAAGILAFRSARRHLGI